MPIDDLAGRLPEPPASSGQREFLRSLAAVFGLVAAVLGLICVGRLFFGVAGVL